FNAAIQLRIYARSRELETHFTVCPTQWPEVAGAKTTRAGGVNARVYDTALSNLGSCRRGSSCFLVLNYPGGLAQHDFAHEHPVTNCRIIDCCGHIWPNGRPTYG